MKYPDSDNNLRKARKPTKKCTSENAENYSGSRKMPKRAAACRDFKEKPVSFPDEPMTRGLKSDQPVVNSKSEAINLTSNDLRPNRRLTDFVFHDIDGAPQPVEMLELRRN